MNRRTTPEVKGRILALGAQNFSRFMIEKKLLKSNVDVSECMISRVLKEAAESTPQKCARGPLPRKRKSRKSGNSTIVKRIRQFTDKDNPLVQKEMARRTKVSQSTVSRIISKKLERKRIKRKTIKRFTDAMIAKRRDRAKGFAELAAGEKAEFILSLDEAVLPLNFKNDNTSHSYQLKKICERRSQAAVATSAPQFPRSITFAAGFSWRGQTRFYPIPEDSKMTGKGFIKSVLYPILFRDVPRLYGKDASRVV